MENVQQDILTVLLHALLEQGLVPRDVHDQAKEAVLQKSDWPDWFHGGEGK